MRKVIVIIFAILGMIIGCAVGEYCSGVSFLSWLALGGEIGLKTPITVDLNFLQFTIGFWCKISIGGVIGMVIFALIAHEVCRLLQL